MLRLLLLLSTLWLGSCADHLRNPLPATVRERIVIGSIRVEMHTSGGPLRGLNTEDASSIAAKIEGAVEQQFEHLRGRGAAGAVDLRIVITSFGLAHGAVAIAGGQVAHHIDGKASFVDAGRVIATYDVAVYRETGNIGVVIGAVRGEDPGWELAEAFARRLYRQFTAN